MDYAKYYEISHKASAMAELEQYDEAIEAFASLVKNQDLATLDRSVMAYNVFHLMQKKGDADGALKWLELAIDFERPLLRFFALEHKAAYLAGQGKKAESRAIYEELLAHAAATESERSRFMQNIAALA